MTEQRIDNNLDADTTASPERQTESEGTAEAIGEPADNVETLRQQLEAAQQQVAESQDRYLRARADMGAVCRLAKEAVDVLASASGGSSIYRDVPIQRIARDVNAVNLHALMHPDTNFELYGRVLCGLSPDTLYI